jgi:hypothetical protein
MISIILTPNFFILFFIIIYLYLEGEGETAADNSLSLHGVIAAVHNVCLIDLNIFQPPLEEK